MLNKEAGLLFWIQSVEDPQLAFVLTDPVGYYYDYKIVPDSRERQKLGIAETADCHVLFIVTVPEDLKVTLNLAAPLLFAPDTNCALQVLLEGTTVSVQNTFANHGRIGYTRAGVEG